MQPKRIITGNNLVGSVAAQAMALDLVADHRNNFEKAQKVTQVVNQCLEESMDTLAQLLANPKAGDPSAVAANHAEHLSTFLQIGGKDAFHKAPAAYKLALQSRGLDITDLDIASCAYGMARGRSFAITRNPTEARSIRKALEASPKTTKDHKVVQWNHGAYIAVFRIKNA